LFVLGPFQVGDWFQAKPTKVFDLTDAPTVPELIKALNRTRVYLIDGRKERLFADGFPLIAVEGDLKHQWAKGKRSWELHVVGVTGPVSATDNSAALPKREIGALAVALWAREKDDEQVVRESLSYFSRRNVRYDITGTLRDS
jgi:hypothetical protein